MLLRTGSTKRRGSTGRRLTHSALSELVPAEQWPLETPWALLRFAERRVLSAVPEARLSAEYLFIEALKRTWDESRRTHLKALLKDLTIEGLGPQTQAWVDVLLLQQPVNRAQLWSAMCFSKTFASQTLQTRREPLAIETDISQLLKDLRAEYRQLCGRRLSREPLQYICGEWDFHGINLKLQAPVLIPRPETEELVEYVLQSEWAQRARAGATLRLLDIGCGTGAIGLALLASLRRARIQAVAIDPNETAVRLTKENARRNQISLWSAGWNEQQQRTPVLKVLQQSIQSYAQAFRTNNSSAENDFETGSPFDLVVSNPPYVLPGELATLAPEILCFEDMAALSGIDEDGMSIIRMILEACDAEPSLLAPGGELWMELDPSQPCRIAELLTRYSTASTVARLELVEVKKDLAGSERFVRIRRIVR
ncbi:hypothetical protein CCYA_CCYA02G0715 [Cyanidiococcus yangmingshanensis]|nr:hypothetical protein CCYA_CCYA02G0715 [Cyanidiococcus yangmingshanensis]